MILMIHRAALSYLFLEIPTQVVVRYPINSAKISLGDTSVIRRWYLKQMAPVLKFETKPLRLQIVRSSLWVSPRCRPNSGYGRDFVFFARSLHVMFPQVHNVTITWYLDQVSVGYHTSILRISSENLLVIDQKVHLERSSSVSSSPQRWFWHVFACLSFAAELVVFSVGASRNSALRSAVRDKLKFLLRFLGLLRLEIIGRRRISRCHGRWNVRFRNPAAAHTMQVLNSFFPSVSVQKFIFSVLSGCEHWINSRLEISCFFLNSIGWNIACIGLDEAEVLLVKPNVRA